eukprot:scaffold522967_cov19-Prasinocladus_malaysianus.AAC.1
MLSDLPREAGRPNNRHTCKDSQTDSQRHSQTDIWADRRTEDKETDRRTDEQTDIWTDNQMQTVQPRQAGRPTDRQTSKVRQ